MLPVIIRVQSTYFEIESSKYRLALTENVLVQSLRNQTNKNFEIVVDISPMDPCFTRRRRVFDLAKVPVQLEHEAVLQRRLEIWVGDDDFLHPGFVESFGGHAERIVNTKLICPNGYIWHDGMMSVWNEHPDMVEAVQIIEDHDRITNSILFTKSPVWIHLRHKMNSSVLSAASITKHEIVNLNWGGWRPNVVNHFCKVEMKTATAQGCELHPLRSKSVVFAKGSARYRRK